MTYRFFDLLFSLIGLVLSSPIIILVFIIGFFDTGSPLFIQERVGLNKTPFKLFKFRTMIQSTKSMATHLANPTSITKFGSFLRKTKLDELPQLWNVIIGDMSIVGPRPNLYNQIRLIKERNLLGVYNVLPGITGLAQINKIDMSTPKLLAQADHTMISTMSIYNYFRYIFATLVGKGFGDRVKKK
ncbi:sugar transferase [Alphaproteobacteria bacterium]|nr:sugar transferase [Alphaproteobacteria bacterium]